MKLVTLLTIILVLLFFVFSLSCNKEKEKAEIVMFENFSPNVNAHFFNRTFVEFGNSLNFKKINSRLIIIEFRSNDGSEYEKISFSIDNQLNIIKVKYEYGDDTIGDDFFYSKGISEYYLKLSENPFLYSDYNDINGKFNVKVVEKKYLFFTKSKKIINGYFN